MTENAVQNEAAEPEAAESEPLVRCWDCEEDVPESEITKVSGNHNVCDRCTEDHWRECDDCGDVVHTDTLTRTIDARGVCDYCRSNDYTYSRIEGEWVRDDDTVTSEDTGNTVSDGYAQNHWEQDDDGNWYEDGVPGCSGLLDYSTNIFDVRTLPPPGASLVFGVELEMEPTTEDKDGQTEIVEALGGDDPDYILKSDASLNYGVELVTKPMTLEEHKDWNWAGVLQQVQPMAQSGEGTTRCGMHVHINKAALSPLLIGKLLVFMNADATDSLICTIAQRRNNGFCKKVVKKLKDGRRVWGHRRSEQRYERLNVTPETCEVRIFRGNLRPERVLKNIEFCHAAIAFCRDASMQDVVVPSAFESFLLKHRSVYSNLVRFLNECKVPAFAGIVRETTKYKKPEVRAEV